MVVVNRLLWPDRAVLHTDPVTGVTTIVVPNQRVADAVNTDLDDQHAHAESVRAAATALDRIISGQNGADDG
ncbi:hypothetical protein BJF83_21505 [Nocardiopsis sp. CNR-923]|uniref:hypothetical protein n=1 Tax=Nocardiopsis sp. CNR-923 TaxID=1904965 RepID=UPI00096107A0|nr:hypothetical protein [Nocardiopsis sp. CNR-923]OLT26380.1 hypothetical protein BJF83_21505 [Nocardiopsis sp. CNR-923]